MKTKIIFIILLSTFMAAQLSAQKSSKKIQISGTVTDKNGMQVEGATILIDFINSGTTSNKKGLYKVKVNNEAKVISAASVSGSVQEIQINGQTVINFTLPIDIKSLSEKAVNKDDEEEVNIGYGTVKRKDLSTAVSKIDGSGDKYAGYSTIYEMLRNQPGVVVNGKSVIIRGINSINSSTEPLYVVDGNAVQTIENIQPREVKSIEILKGASAAIYGTRGANGVIMITLKK
jgi:TonB-dependent SusC/RagA subfamily outer membrane receptor